MVEIIEILINSVSKSKNDFNSQIDKHLIMKFIVVSQL